MLLLLDRCRLSRPWPATGSCCSCDRCRRRFPEGSARCCRIRRVVTLSVQRFCFSCDRCRRRFPEGSARSCRSLRFVTLSVHRFCFSCDRCRRRFPTQFPEVSMCRPRPPAAFIVFCWPFFRSMPRFPGACDRALFFFAEAPAPAVPDDRCRLPRP